MDAVDVLRLKTDSNKVGVPKDRDLISREQALALQTCIDEGWLVWLDCECHPSIGWRPLDVYLVTAEGLKALDSSPANL